MSLKNTRNSNMKALVTGAEGFVGQHLVEYLLKNNYKVIATSLKGAVLLNKEVKSYALDILDKESTEKIFLENKPDIVFHLAAINTVSLENADLTKKVNINGTRNILDCALKVGANVVVIGSAQQYGIPKYLPIDEEHPMHPINPYGESKLTGEKLALEYFRKGLEVFIMRSFNHIGPGQTEGFVCSDFAKQIAQIESGKQNVIKVGDLTTKRDFTDVRDVVRAYVLAIEKAESGAPYNICSGKSYEISQILKKLIQLSNVRIKVEKDSSKYRKSEIPILEGDNSKFYKRTGWHPEIKIEDSLSDILDYWRERLT